MGPYGGHDGVVTLVLIVATLSAALTVVGGGRPSRLREVRLRRGRLLGTALAVWLAGFVLSFTWAAALIAGTALAFALAAWFCWLNRDAPGMPLVAAGLAATALVIALNTGLPVSLHALEWSGSDTTLADLADDRLREAADATTIVPFLGEIIPLAWPVAPQVVTPGDVLVAAGIALVVSAALTGHLTIRGTIEPVRDDMPGRRLPELEGAIHE